jgi:hypothetical protein
MAKDEIATRELQHQYGVITAPSGTPADHTPTHRWPDDSELRQPPQMQRASSGLGNVSGDHVFGNDLQL